MAYKNSRWRAFVHKSKEDFIAAIGILFGGSVADDSGIQDSYITKPSESSGIYDLDTPLLNIPLANGDEDEWTLRNAVQGVQIFGGIGSGKSSGSGQTLAKAFLEEGYGGVILTAKKEEIEVWKKYADDDNTGRTLTIFQDDGKYFFNPLQYQVDRNGGIVDTLNLTNLVMSIYEMGKSFTSGGASSSGERYWDDQLRLFISRSIDLLNLAGEMVSITNIRKIMTSTPDSEAASMYESNSVILDKDLTAYDEEKDREKIEEYNKAGEDLQRMLDNSYCLRCVLDAGDKEQMSEDENDVYNLIESYFLKEFATLSEKTRSIVETSFYGMIEPFMGGILKKYFTKGVSSALNPERCYTHGDIIIINFPVKEHLVSGVYAQAIYKKLWQEAIEARPVKKDGTDRPVFLWIDEAQYFLGKDDAKFQTTARSSLACTVFITQNMSNYYAAIGGKYPKETTNSLLGVLGTKIFHANNDYVTNEWAANTIGRDFRLQQSTSSSMGQFSGSVTESEALHYQVEPREFTTLRSGGELNEGRVDAIITVAGKEWAHGKNFARITFTQNFDEI